MSRIGKRPISLPSGVTASVAGRTITVTGPKGSLTWEHPDGIVVEEKGGSVLVRRKIDSRELRAMHGLTRALLANMIHGVSEGYEKKLKIVGVGYRAEPSGQGLRLLLGYSHPIDLPAPPGISFAIDKNVVSVSGIDKQLVGETAARLRALRKPEPYKGKGIMYVDEQIRRKPGKAAKAVGPGAAEA